MRSKRIPREAKMAKLRDGWLLVTLMMLLVMAVSPGCMQDNNAEFLRTAPPGVPSEFPDETVAQRRERLRRPSPLDKKLEAKRAAIAKAAAKKAAAAGKTPE
jgi:hypothetical protein